jgi:peptidoglycan hydrolase-like protein with peptidoglycan-binding domain
MSGSRKVRKRSRREEAVETGRGAKVAAAIGRHPREFVGLVMATAATFTIFVNALFLQKGPHPAPIFATRQPAPVSVPMAPQRPQTAPAAVMATSPADSTTSRSQLISDIQRELNRRGYYDGVVDGVWGARTDAAARDFAQATGVKMNVEASDALLRAILSSGAKRAAAEPAQRTNDPIAQLIAPSKRVLAVQRALADFGYGQLKPTGLYDPDTRAAIEKFERDRRLPVTGQVSDRVVRELAAMTGRPLE